jgi:hypothetical protein
MSRCDHDGPPGRLADLDHLDAVRQRHAGREPVADHDVGARPAAAGRGR